MSFSPRPNQRCFCLGPSSVATLPPSKQKDSKNNDNADSIVVPLCKVKEEQHIDILQLEDTIESFVVVVAAVEDEKEHTNETEEEITTTKPKITDAQWLNCRRDAPVTLYYQTDNHNDQYEKVVIEKTILGLLEQQQQQPNSSCNVCMTIYTPDLTQQQNQQHCCPCVAPHYDWKRNVLDYNAQTLSCSSSNTIQFDWIDLRSWQQQQYQQTHTSFVSFLQTPSQICYFLRSLLGSSHDASPWWNNNNNDKEQQEQEQSADVVAILLSTSSLQQEQDELDMLLNFHHGNASPSYYLHSSTKLQNVPMNTNQDDEFESSSLLWILQQEEESLRSCTTNTEQHDTHKEATLVVFRRLPPRDHMSSVLPTSTNSSSSSSLTPGCLWESYIPKQKKDNHEESNTSGNEPSQPPKPQLRMTGPPYINHMEEFSNLLEPFLQEEIIQIIQQEAMKIPQWTAWPEKQHYSSTSGQNDDNDDNNDGGGSVESWTVFPLCHCFPSNMIERRKWISVTSQFVPQTTQLLQTYLGTHLRTALFSKLQPNTVLEPHTGWEDLANYVYRIHIPLQVPPSSAHGHDDNGFLCGTWVDGCVETHAMGNIICFDDSKVHRAFNYSSTHSRVVLILDLVRPSHLPLGTATGGHTEELDKFIDQLQ